MWYFADIFYFPKKLSLKSFGNSWGNMYIPLLVYILTYICNSYIPLLVYILINTNNHTSFHFRWKENLVKYQEVSEYCDHDYSQFLSSATITFYIRSLQKHLKNIRANNFDLQNIAKKCLVFHNVQLLDFQNVLETPWGRLKSIFKKSLRSLEVVKTWKTFFELGQ